MYGWSTEFNNWLKLANNRLRFQVRKLLLIGVHLNYVSMLSIPDPTSPSLRNFNVLQYGGTCKQTWRSNSPAFHTSIPGRKTKVGH